MEEPRLFCDKVATPASPAKRHASAVPGWVGVWDGVEVGERLLTGHRIEILVGGPEDDLLRLSVAAYTTREEVDRPLAALVRELDAEHRQQDE